MSSKRKRCFYISGLFVAGILLSALGNTFALEIESVEMFKGSLVQGADYFGYSVAIDGTNIVVGAPLEDFPVEEGPWPTIGAAYIFDFSSGVQEQQILYAADLEYSQFFGNRVEMEDDYVVVSDWLNDEYGVWSGAVYVYHKGAIYWEQVQKITPENASANLHFGKSLSLDGTTLAVGQIGYASQGGAIDNGAVHVFERVGSQFIPTDVLTASDGVLGDEFGYDVAVVGDTLFVGAHKHQNELGGRGAVYVFERDGSIWIETQKLLASDGEWGNHFGIAMDYDGESLVVSDYGINPYGAVYVFKEVDGVWIEEQKLTPSRPVLEFGFALGVDKGTLAIGASIQDHYTDDGGNVFVFNRGDGTWTEEYDYRTYTYDLLGRSVAIEDDNFVVGAWGDDYYSGLAYLFKAIGSKQIDCIGFDSPLDNYPVTIKGRRPALPLRATLEFEDDTPVTDTDITKPPVVAVYFEPAEDDEAMDITGDVTPSITPDVGNEFLFTTGGVWQFILGLENYSSSGTYTVRMESADPGEYEFDEECITEFIVP